MRRIIYVSSATKYLNSEEIESFLLKTREKNAINGITGVLLYADGDFFQVIEGPKIKMINLFQNIQKDSRHRGILTMVNIEIEEKHFPNWNMGFYNSTYEKLSKINNYESISKQSISNFDDKKCLVLIDSFISSHQSDFVFV